MLSCIILLSSLIKINIFLTDVNVCENGSIVCGTNAVCKINTTAEEGYTCTCNSGFEYNGHACQLREMDKGGITVKPIAS